MADLLSNIIQQFSRMPGIGQKTATRLAFYLLSLPKSDINEFIKEIEVLRDTIGYCPKCYHISENGQLCGLCSDVYRDSSMLFIVSSSKDLLAIEKAVRLKALYHVLGGVISPLDGIGSEQLRIKELLQRIKNEDIKEIIFALDSSIEGETTVMYLTKLLSPLGVKLSKLAQGIPIGADLEWADELTLIRAFEGRRSVSNE